MSGSDSRRGSHRPHQHQRVLWEQDSVHQGWLVLARRAPGYLGQWTGWGVLVAGADGNLGLWAGAAGEDLLLGVNAFDVDALRLSKHARHVLCGRHGGGSTDSFDGCFSTTSVSLSVDWSAVDSDERHSIDENVAGDLARLSLCPELGVNRKLATQPARTLDLDIKHVGNRSCHGNREEQHGA